MEILKKIWHQWKKFGQTMGDFIARVALTIFYFTILVPFGLVVHFFMDMLDSKGPTASWIKRTTGDKTLDQARRQG